MSQHWSWGFGRAAARVPAPPPGRVPRVGLALGAGAARGWAQIGVMRELLSAGLRPDIVAGASIGAVIGGCYCAGQLDGIEAFALALTRRRVFGLMDVSLSGMGVLAGGKLKSRLDRELGDTAVEALPVRFASVATEVGTGHEIWLTQGRLVDAIRASYALPGLFEPVRLDGRWLMDGALVNPVPVSLCRALGADIVVAVNLVAETLGRRHAPLGEGEGATAPLPAAPSFAGVLVDAFNITQDRIARSRLAGDPPDVTVNVRCGRIGLFDFHRAAELITLGRDAVTRTLPDLREYLELYPAAVASPPNA